MFTKLRKSIHSADAHVQLPKSSDWAGTILKYANKWRISKTLVYNLGNNIKTNYYLDLNNNYIIVSAHYAEDSVYPIIGERIEINRKPEII